MILDGNRRWASRAGLTDVGAGHRRGADKIDELLDWCSELGIREVTLWALSGENLARPTRELEALLEVVAGKLDELAERATRPGKRMRIRVFGRLGDLPPGLQAAIERARAMTADNDGLSLNIALGYSGREELVDACRSMVRHLADEGVAAGEMAERVTRRGARGPPLHGRTARTRT